MSLIKSSFDTIRRQKAWLIVGGFVGILLGGGYLATVPPHYTSTMLIASASHGGSNLSESAGRNLSLAGSLFGSVQNPDFTRVLALMHSDAVASTLQRKYQIIQKLHPKAWDSDTKQWRRPSGIISTATQWLNRLFGRPEWQPPGTESLVAELAKRIRIDQTDNKGIYMVAFTADNPELSHDVLQEVFSEADELARGDALKAASAYVASLETEIKSTSNDQTMRGLIDLYVQQEQRKIVLSSDIPFAADILSAPTTPSRPSGLSPSILLLMGMLVGAAAFFAIAVYLSSLDAEDSSEEAAVTAR